LTLITCKCDLCGYTDNADNFITLSPIRKVKQLTPDSEEVFMHLVDKTFKCPKCGVTEVTTVSMGFSFVEPDEEEW